MVLLIGAFIKFFVFGDVPSSEATANARAFARSQAQKKPPHRSFSLYQSTPQKTLKKERSLSHVLRHPPRLSTKAILSKTYYNVNAHQPESLDWFNVLIAQTIAQFRSDAVDDDAILTSLTGALNGSQKPDYLGEVKVTEINLGEEFPILSNCRVHPIDNKHAGIHGAIDGLEPALQARMDVDLSDFITLGIDTKLLLNYPRPLTAVLPVALSVSIVRFSGTLSISFLPSSSSSPEMPSSPQQPASTTPTTLAFSFLPDYRLDLSIRSLVGSRSRLQDVPKIAELVEQRLHQWIDERCVEPRIQQVVLPSLWPRKKNTRGPSGSEAADHESTPRGSLTRNAGLSVKNQLRDHATRLVPDERRQPSRVDSKGFEEGLRIRRKDYESSNT